MSKNKIEEFIENQGLGIVVKEMPQTCRSAAEAAASIGCQPAQIGKSIIFKDKAQDQAVLVITSGVNTVDAKKLANQNNLQLEKADADFVREKTGYVIGGVPPFAHAEPVRTFMDESLFQYAEIWVAAGHPYKVMRVTPQELHKITGAQLIAV